MIRRFIHWLIILAFVLSMLACAPASAQLTASPMATPTVAPSINPDVSQPLVLVMPSQYNDLKTLIAANRHYSDAVKHKGWNVEFYTVQSYDSNGTDIYLPYVNKQVCSGSARADGFVCMQYMPRDSADPLHDAKASGQFYDCVTAAPQAVPQYWSKFQDQIAAGKYGLVLANRQEPDRSNDLVLTVRKDVLPLATQPISRYDDLRALLARLEKAHHEKAYVKAHPHQLLDLWIRQQGYLELFSSAGIYARVDDPDAKPVLLEDIPGFQTFFEDMIDLQKRGLARSPFYSSANIGSDSQSPIEQSSIGPAAMLSYANSFLYSYSAQDVDWKAYTAFPFEDDSSYADNISEAMDAKRFYHYVILRELIIPARSRRAADAMGFIQWVYADRRNADAAIFGQEGEDYALQGERVALLGSTVSQDSQGLSSWQRWPGLYLFQYAAERRIAANAPQNAETLVRAKPARPLAAPWLVHLSDGKAWESLISRNSMDLRELAMSSLWDMSGGTGDAVQFIKQLRAGATASALQPYLDVLAEARAAAQP